MTTPTAKQTPEVGPGSSLAGERRLRAWACACASLALTAALWLAPVEAQELRQTRVGDLVLYAPAGYEAELDRMAAIAMVVMPRLQEDLGHGVDGPFTIYLIPPGRLDPGLAGLASSAPSWASGFLSGASRVGALRLDSLVRYPHDDTASVLAHEIAHQVIYDAAGELPRWLSEGIATWEGRRWGLRDFAVQSASVLGGSLPTLAELEDDFASSSNARRAYAASFDFVRWSTRRYGRDFVPRLLAAAGDRSVPEAWREASGGVELSVSEARWRRSTLFFHRWVPILASSGTLWAAISGLALVAGLVRRRRTREQYERWEAEEAAAARELEDVERLDVN